MHKQARAPRLHSRNCAIVRERCVNMRQRCVNLRQRCVNVRQRCANMRQRCVNVRQRCVNVASTLRQQASTLRQQASTRTRVMEKYKNNIGKNIICIVNTARGPASLPSTTESCVFTTKNTYPSEPRAATPPANSGTLASAYEPHCAPARAQVHLFGEAHTHQHQRQRRSLHARALNLHGLDACMSP